MNKQKENEINDLEKVLDSLEKLFDEIEDMNRRGVTITSEMWNEMFVRFGFPKHLLKKT